MRLPRERSFAFSILDDTDDSMLENARPVYERLRELGLRTTKTVWLVDCPEGSRDFYAADTLQRAESLAFVRELAKDGFEIASHGATMETSVRERTVRGIELLERELGHCPRLYRQLQLRDRAASCLLPSSRWSDQRLGTHVIERRKAHKRK
jgi:hypothetical protein